MALLSFPSSPSSGDLYPNVPVIGQNQYRWSQVDQTWVLEGAATGVAAGTYGDASNVGQFTVDTQGRLTFAQNVPIASGAGGTVTQIDTGTGLSGGPITSTGTVTLDTTYTDTLYLQLAGGTMTGDITFSGTQTFPAQDLDEVTTAGNTTANSIDVGALIASGLTYPVADGTVDQVLATDGAGVLGWLSTLKVVPVPALSTDPGNLGEVAVGAGFFYFYDGGQWLKVAGVPV